MEGLRAWPFLHEADNRGFPVEHLLDCGLCKEKLSVETRQAMGCGWETAEHKMPVKTWSPAGMPGNEDWKCISKTRPEPTVCPGYSVTLPETIEIARAYTHWITGGGLRDFTDGDITSNLRIGVEIFCGAVNECQRWAMANPRQST